MTGPDVVTVGESLGLVMGEPASPLRAGSSARFSFAGAESNVAIGLALLLAAAVDALSRRRAGSSGLA